MKLVEDFDTSVPFVIDPDSIEQIQPAKIEGKHATVLIFKSGHSCCVKGQMLDVARALEKF
jgi:hypothetical protein